MQDQPKRPSLREAARRGAAPRHASAAPAPAPPPAPPADPAVRLACGHDRLLSKLAAQPCPKCADAARAEAAKRRQAKNAARAAKRQAEGRKHECARLPMGSRFNAWYDAEKVIWTGWLIVPGYATFEAQASGLSKLMHALDGLYRAALAGAGEGTGVPAGNPEVP